MGIPFILADCSRVTHPYATNPEEQAPPSSFDLHVLGTPPAFVLSQDQTLQANNYIKYIKYLNIKPEMLIE